MDELPTFRIILLEDDPDDLNVFREIIASWESPICRIELDVHRTYHTAIDRMKSGNFDLLITDYFLSGAFQDEQSCTAKEFLVKVIATHKHIPVVIWTGTNRLDVDPELIKSVLNRQIHYCPKHKFNLGTLRYLISAVQLATLSVLVVSDQPAIAEEVQHLVGQSEFYRFTTRMATSLEKAFEAMRIKAPELCLVDLPVDEAQFRRLQQETDATGTSLLVTCVSEQACAQVADGRVRLADSAQSMDIPVLTDTELHDPALPEALVRQRNRIPL